MLVAVARWLDPARLRRAMAHLRFVADPDAADHHTQRRHQQRGLWLASTWEAMVAVDGVLDPEAGQRLLVALEPLAHPRRRRRPPRIPTPGRRLTELARRTLEAGRLAAPERRGPGPS
jgi:hypothetical protein